MGKMKDVMIDRMNAEKVPQKNKGTYKRKYYLHRRIKKAGFCLELERCSKTIKVEQHQVQEAQENKYIAELQNRYSYGVQLINPMIQCHE